MPNPYEQMRRRHGHDYPPAPAWVKKRTKKKPEGRPQPGDQYRKPRTRPNTGGGR